MLRSKFEKHKRLYKTEDWLFAWMRVLIVTAAIIFYGLGQFGLIAVDNFPNLLLMLCAFVAWSVVVVWSIYHDATLRSHKTRRLKLILVGVSLAIDGAFIYYAARFSSGIHSPFFYAVFVLIVFHAYYFPSYVKATRPKRFHLVTSGAVSGLALFILLYIALSEQRAIASFEFYVDAFLAFILSLTAGLLRLEERQKSDELQRSNELAKLFRGIIDRMNKMHANDQPQSHLFDDLATTIGENLSAMACEVFVLEQDGAFIRKGMWIRTDVDNFESFKAILKGYDTIILGSEYEVGHLNANRVGRYDENQPDFQVDQNPLSQKMAVFLAESLITHSLFTLILKPRDERKRGKSPIGIIRVTNRLDGFGDIKENGFSSDDEEVIQDVAKEISSAFENYQLQQLLSKTAERQSYLKQLALMENLNEIMQEILKNMSEMVSANYAELWTPFDDGFERTPKLVLRAHYPIKEHVLNRLSEAERVISVKNSFIGKSYFGVQQNGGITFYDDISKEKDFAWNHLIPEFGTSKFISIPLQKGQEMLGVVCLHPQNDVLLGEKVQQQLEEFANLAAVSLQSARLRRRFVQLNALRKNLDALLVEDEKWFYHNIAYLVRDVVEADACTIYLVSDDKKTHELRGHSYFGEGKKRENWKTPTYNTRNIVEKVIEKGVAVVCSNHTSVAVKKKKSKSASNLPLACMACPVFDSHNNIIAVMYCKDKINSPNIVTKTFSNSDLELFELTVGIIGAILENRLNIMRLEEINKRRRNFLSSVAHEFTSPLQSIRMTTEFLKKYHANPERLKNPDAQFDFLIEEVDFLHYLTANIRTQFAEGVYEFRGSEPEKTNLFSLVEKIQTLLKSQAKEKGLDIKLLSRFPVLKVDRFHLEQVVFNLLVNAIKYTLPTTSNPIIEIVCEDRHPHLLLMFRNWGVGVRPNESNRIFEMFIRGSEAHAGSVTGTGLGLYISKKIMQKMGGDLLLTKLDDPTEFTVFVPRQ